MSHSTFRRLAHAGVGLGLGLLSGCNLWPSETNPFTTVERSTDMNSHILDVYEMVTWWTIIIAILVFALLAYVLVRFRDDGTPGNPKQIHGNPQLELAWTMIPVLIVVAITVPTIRTIFILADAAPADALEIRVVGKRWWWQFDYVESGVTTANEIHVPVGRTISLLLESDTVIHSFWVPRLGGKRDAVPGRVNRLWFTITDEVAEGQAPIEYLGECAEFCGEQHARMRKRVYAHAPADFEQWLADMQTPVTFADPAVQQKGEQVFGAAGCGGCHAVVGNKAANGRIGPDLTRYGQRHSIGAGALLLDGMSDEEKAKWLGQWIRDPNSIKSGTTTIQNKSRNMDGMNIPLDKPMGEGISHGDGVLTTEELSDEDLNALVTYLLAMK